MPEGSADLLALMGARGLAGSAFGIGFAGVLWLLSLTRTRAAPVVAVLLTTSYVAVGWPLALLIGLQLTTAGIVGHLGDPGTRPGVLDTLGLAALTALCALGSLSGFAPAYWLAAACGAAVGAAAIWASDVVGRHRLTATTAVVAGLVIAAMRLQLLGVGEPALAAVAAMSGLALVRQMRRTRPVRLAIGALIAGALSAFLTALLP